MTDRTASQTTASAERPVAASVNAALRRQAAELAQPGMSLSEMHKRAQAAEQPLTAQQIMQAIVSSFDSTDPDEKIVSIGHYVEHSERLLPKFYARVQVTLGDVRRCAHG